MQIIFVDFSMCWILYPLLPTGTHMAIAGLQASLLATFPLYNSIRYRVWLHLSHYCWQYHGWAQRILFFYYSCLIASIRNVLITVIEFIAGNKTFFWSLKKPFVPWSRLQRILYNIVRSPVNLIIGLFCCKSFNARISFLFLFSIVYSDFISKWKLLSPIMAI